jgi:acetyl-CoA carboxylase biotin carboxyl carrier protein
MDIRKVKKLIELLEESGVSEIEIKEGEESVRISRHPTGTMHTIATPVAYSTPAAAIGAAAGAAAGASAAATASTAAAPSPDQVVTAPMVGTFYSAPAPGAKAFVEIGSEVKPATCSASSKP